MDMGVKVSVTRVAVFSLLFLSLIIFACAPVKNTPPPDLPTEISVIAVTETAVSATLSPNKDEHEFTFYPTPDPAHIPYPEPPQPTQHTVLPGETLDMIAGFYGLNSGWLASYNQLENSSQVAAGAVIKIPVPELGPSFKIIPDSELIYGPASINFDTQAFIKAQGGYLANYGEDVDGRFLNAAEIINLVAQRYSVNPRLLLALIEYQSGWLTELAPLSVEYPLGYEYWWSSGLYKQLIWTANELNRGYYLWKAGDTTTWTLADNSMVMIEPTINAGTAGMQNFFAKIYGQEDWSVSVSQNGFIQTYFDLYGSPFDYEIEPLLPESLDQPIMQLPFSSGEIWAFTSGPHDGWDTGSPWSALDFAPPGEPQGCSPNVAWVVAVADGTVVYADKGIVLLDLDGDGHEQTGWTVFYMHIENRDRIANGATVKAGDRLGHPSCEGGIATAAHVHLARRYNGEWIPAVGESPFVLDRWVVFGNNIQYGGYFQRNDERVDAWAGYGTGNHIQR